MHAAAPTVASPLTNTEVSYAKAIDRDLTGGDGLFLMVRTSGKKLWRFRYQHPLTNSVL